MLKSFEGTQNSLPGVGVFGTGVTAKAIAILLKASGFCIEALWGKTEEEAKSLSVLLDTPFCTSQIDDLLLNPRVNLVCINCPPFLQSQIAVKTLGIGKNVLCERLASMGFEDTERMLTAARYYPSLMSLMTYYMRFLPSFREMKKLISDGFIGDLMVIEVRVHCGVAHDMFFNWYHDSRMGGGVLSSFGGHFIDLISYISGQKAKRVHGFLTTFQKHTNKVSGFREITSDDFCSFVMKLDKDACCTCTINNNVPGQFSYEILAVGSKACLTAKNGILCSQSRSSEVVTQPLIIIQDDVNVPSVFESEFLVDVVKQMPLPFIQGLLKFIESLKKSFLEEGDHRRWDKSLLDGAATFEDALYVQTVLDAIRKSSKSTDWEQIG